MSTPQKNEVADLTQDQVVFPIGGSRAVVSVIAVCNSLVHKTNCDNFGNGVSGMLYITTGSGLFGPVDARASADYMRALVRRSLTLPDVALEQFKVFTLRVASVLHNAHFRSGVVTQGVVEVARWSGVCGGR